jgi:hypothetical protein
VLSQDDFSFQAGSQSGPSLAIELIGPHVRLGGTIRLGHYVRLSDLLNLHDATLTLAQAVVLNRTGLETADSVPTLDVRLDAISLVIDHSGYISPAPPEDVGIQKTSHRLMAVTEAHLITATFFIYPGAEPASYLLAAEPRWIPLTNVRVRSLVDRRIKYGAMFAVLNRSSVGATTVL